MNDPRCSIADQMQVGCRLRSRAIEFCLACQQDLCIHHHALSQWKPQKRVLRRLLAPTLPGPEHLAFLHHQCNAQGPWTRAFRQSLSSASSRATTGLIRSTASSHLFQYHLSLSRDYPQKHAYTLDDHFELLEQDYKHHPFQQTKNGCLPVATIVKQRSVIVQTVLPRK